MRSSALGEDSATVSFAGLYSSVLNVDRTNIVAAYKEVIAGKYGARAIAYRRKRGYRHEDIEMCVGCMIMVDALVSGVVYSIDPGQEDNGLLRINATAGIAKGVVDGSQAADLFLISREFVTKFLQLFFSLEDQTIGCIKLVNLFPSFLILGFILLGFFFHSFDLIR